jgi:hypothetical protein
MVEKEGQGRGEIFLLVKPPRAGVGVAWNRIEEQTHEESLKEG